MPPLKNNHSRTNAKFSPLVIFLFINSSNLFDSPALELTKIVKGLQITPQNTKEAQKLILIFL